MPRNNGVVGALSITDQNETRNKLSGLVCFYYFNIACFILL